MEHEVQLAVVGGGASGLMLAYQAAKRGISTIIIDPNRFCGRKLRITGKGRCNITNNCDIKEFMQNIPGDGRFLYSALNRFSPRDTMDFFEQNGLPLKTERGRRVFPVSDNANDVANLLERLCTKHGVQFLKGRVKRIIVDNGSISRVETENDRIQCTTIALCTGGLSYPLTGSDGFGYRLAERLGHTIIKPRASLVALTSCDPCCEKMQGLSLKNVSLKVKENGKVLYEELGEMLFTHFGVSGPLVLSASAHMRNTDYSQYQLSIDLKPGLSEEKLEARLLRDLTDYANRDFKTILAKLVPSSMVPVMVERCGIPEDRKGNSITVEQRKTLLKALKDFSLSVSGTRPIDEAIITAGGVNTKEVNPRTMESKLQKGLYFAGEILNLDGYTGGYNLQIAWSTAYVAGNSVLMEYDE